VKRQRHLWASRGNCPWNGADSFIRFYPKRPKRQRDRFGDRVTFTGHAVRSLCVEDLQRFTGFTLEPGQCVKVNVSITPADGSHSDIPTKAKRKRAA
jgi:hypothetical protein